MSAVEALAEVLDGHLEQGWDIATMPGLPGPKLERDPHCICGWRPDVMPDKTHEWRTAFIAHEAPVLVAAIRSMPAEQVAELIDGEVEREECGEYYSGLTGQHVASQPDMARVVTPWLPLGVSPETNGEQK